MIHSVRFTIVLDTNVIYPIEIRDILLWFAYYDLYTPKWSNHIFDELKRLMKAKGISQEIIDRQINNMNRAFPDALVQGYESIIDTLSLKDKKDCHVLAAAIKTNANLIVTNNLKHFPSPYLSMFDIEAKSADDFICDIIDLNQIKARDAFIEMVSNKNNPPLDNYQMLEIFRKRGLNKSADYLHALL